jgi:eukaryotic translation initiation factor 2C
VRISKDTPFNVVLKLVNKIKSESLNSFIKGNTKLSSEVLSYLMCLDIIIKQKALEKFPVVKSTYYLPENSQEISRGLKVCQGFYQSCKPTSGKILLNVDSASTVFYPNSKLVDFVFKCLGLRSPGELKQGLRPNDISTLKLYIKGLDVGVFHRNKRFKIKDISVKPAESITFNVGDRETNVAEYFKEKYNIQLEYPSLQCVIVNKEQNFPIELCHIAPNQKYLKKLDDLQVADIIKFSCKKPHIRFEQIEKNNSNFNNKDNKHLQEFGISIDSRCISADARIIPTPKLQYFGQRDSSVLNIEPQDGVWDLRYKRFINGAELKSWGVLCIGSPRDIGKIKVQNFIRELVKICGQAGIRFRNREPLIDYSSPQQIEVNLKKIYHQVGREKNGEPQLLVCILHQKSTDIYADIKRVCDNDLKVPTQCIVSKNIYNPKPQYLSNVGLKLNAKAGGENNYVRSIHSKFVDRTPTMICGADISNPGVGGKGSSIASFVGSMNRELTSWASTISKQPPKQDIILNTKEMVVELLKSFKKINKRLPNQMLFYRDGVSEGQFKTVKDSEIASIRQACSDMGSDKIAVTFVIVQKRHHSRFLSADRNFQDRSGNCIPGTVIDKSITHPVEFDFFLFSHSGIQGTSKPTRYYVIEDDNKFSADELQILTYNLCYLYSRCTRSVSVVTPVYYAHLVGNRARLHNYSLGITDDDYDQGDPNKSVTEACTKLFYV